MSSKPAKYGIKIFALVSTSNFVTTNLQVHIGKQPESPFKQSNDTKNLVLHLVEASLVLETAVLHVITGCLSATSSYSLGRKILIFYLPS